MFGLNSTAQEWPRFRGPNGSGSNPQATQIPSSFTDKDYRWTAALPGPGTSSPVLWGTKLFLTAQSEAEEARSVLCYDSTTGKLLWSHADAFRPHSSHRFNNFASSTPAVDARHLYVAWTSGEEMHALALTHDGKKVWERNLGYYSEKHGSGASPVVVGGVLVVPKDHGSREGSIFGLKTADGSIAWKLPRKSARGSFSTPLVSEHTPGHPVLVISGSPCALAGIDPANGKLLWQQDFDQPSEFRAVGSPAQADGVFLATVGMGMGGREGVAVRVKAGKPEISWELPKALSYVPTPLGMGRHFYMLNDGGILSCLKAATGELVYSERLTEDVYSSPVSAGDRIYCISRKGTVTVVKAGPQFKILGKSTLGEPCDSTPAIANGMMFFRTSKRLIALGSAKPTGANFHQGKGANVEMITEVNHVQPGQPFTVGFNLRHDDHYHTYWKNPGLAGVPFSVAWTLPDGWKASPIAHAVPDQVFMYEYRTHGYERDVFHLVQITPPTTTELKEVTLKAKASWMACAKTCNPTYCDISLTIPINPSPPQFIPVWRNAFEQTRAEVPTTTDAWKFTATREGNTIHLTGTPTLPGAGNPFAKPYPIFFSDDNLICSHAPQHWRWDGSTFTADLTISEFPPKAANALTGLLFTDKGWEQNAVRPYIKISVPIAAASRKTAGN